MRKLVIVVFALIVSFSGFAQKEEGEIFYFNRALKEVNFEEEKELYENFAEDPLGLRMAFVKKEYTYKPAPTPLTPNPTIEVDKPTIYYSVKKLYNQYKKEVKKGNLSLEEANEKLGEVVKITVNIRYLDTQDLEKALARTKGAEQIESVFSKVEFQ